MTDHSAHARIAATETWIFDLDNTLYPPRHSLFDLVDQRIGAFIAHALDLAVDEARRVQKTYFRDYGTTLRGLMTEHDIDPRAFLDFVHDIDLRRVPPDPELDRALGRLMGRKIVFTNGSRRHAERVMARLGIGRHFDGIFDIAAADYVPKPQVQGYHALIERHAVDPRAATMVEDIARNLVPASRLGMTTVWLRNDTAWGRAESDGDHVDHVIDDLTEWLTRLVAGPDDGVRAPA